MSVTIYDIARHANVSKSTVSRVINNSSDISDKTREKVLLSMKELNFTPNKLAQGLSKASNNAISIIYTRPLETTKENPFFSNVITSIASIAEKYKFDIILQVAGNEETSDVIDKIKANKVKGVILLASPHDNNLLKYIDRLNIPSIIIGHVENKYKNIYSVDTDNYHDAYQLTKYLIDNDHKEIACLHSPLNFNVSRHRLDGVLACLKDHNIKINNEFIIDAGFTLNESNIALEKALSKVVPTALIALDDLKVFSLYQQVTSRGLKIPDDISVVGFMSIEFSKLVYPNITCIEIPTNTLGSSAAQLLFDIIINENDIPKKTIIKTDIHYQDSVKKHNRVGDN